MTHQTIGFSTTEAMHTWIDTTDIQGPVSIVDNWTYGHCEVSPTMRSYRESGIERSFLAKDWRTVSQPEPEAYHCFGCADFGTATGCNICGKVMV